MRDPWIMKFKQSIVPQIIQEFQPERMVLFGSRIKGNAQENSDIDVIVVSNVFGDMPFVKRMSFLLKKIKFNKHVDFLCYSPAEFQKIKNTSSIVIDALKYGESIVPSRLL